MYIYTYNIYRVLRSETNQKWSISQIIASDKGLLLFNVLLDYKSWCEDTTDITRLLWCDI